MLKFVFIFVTFFACTFGASIPEGFVAFNNDRIVGGEVATIRSFPYQVSLQRSGGHFCGGSIYSETIIITAAHCLEGVSKSNLKVRAGSSFVNSGGVLLSVKDFKYHENFDSSIFVNDVGVIRLASPLTFGPTIQSIKLATTEPEYGTFATVSGWGTVKSGSSSLPLQLRSVQIKLISREECASSKYSYGTSIKETMFCAITDGKDSCQGDSGGPLVLNDTLFGIVSWGAGCAGENSPGVYAFVVELHKWIESTAKSI